MKQGKIVTVVPSRLGSNRVPMKGMRLLGGKTLIEHTIGAIKASRYFSSDVFINSDAIEWQSLAEENAETRPLLFGEARVSHPAACLRQRRA